MENHSDDDRREYRKKRRIRNQVIAYISIFLVLGAVTAGAVVGVSALVDKVSKQNQAKKLAAELEEKAVQQQDAVVEPPVVPEESETAVEEVDWLEEMVETVLSEMPLEDKVAGLFIITPEALTGVGEAIQAGDGTKEALNDKSVGGLVYFAKNIKDKEQITQMLSNTVNMSKYPLFLAVDEEGGTVSRVAEAGLDVEKVEDMGTVGASGNPNLAYQSGGAIGSYLAELGFNLDFAPVADVVADPENSPLGTRSFGSDAAAVGEMVSSAVTGLQETKVMSACLKHFPGLGSAAEDTHDGEVVTNRTLDEMRAEDFLPFQAGIEAGVHMIMVGHISAPEITGDNTPASLSDKVITDILRNELGYQGIVVTDAMNMGAVTKSHTSAEAAVMAIKAGVDMILMPEDFEEAYEGVLAAVQDGTIDEERINESIRRIYRVKFRNRVAQDPVQDETVPGSEEVTSDAPEDTAADTEAPAETEAPSE